MYFSCFLLVLKKTCYGNTKLIIAWKNRTFWSLSTCVWRGGATRSRVMTRVDSAPPQRQTFFSLPSVTLTLAAAADDQLRDARVHVDYSAAVERRGRWREETRRRVLQRERLPREVRVAMPQPAHHAHFCRVQTSPGMSEYDIIPDPRCVNISFNATF